MRYEEIEKLKKAIEQRKFNTTTKAELNLVFSSNEIKKIPILYFKIASKGDSILGTEMGWFILDVLYNEFMDLIKHYEKLEITAIPLRYDENRKYAIVKALKISVKKTEKEQEKELIKGFQIPYKDMIIRYGNMLVKYYTVEKEVTRIGKEVREEVIDRKLSSRSVNITEHIDVISNDQRSDVTIFDPILGFAVHQNQAGSYKVRFFKGISRKDLKRISRAFVIAYPEVSYSVKKSFQHVRYTLYRVFYDGREYEIPFFNSKPAQLNFRITTRRFALSKHYRNAFNVNLVNATEEEFIKALHYLKDFDYEGIRVKKDLTEYERFLEMFFVRTPKRKFAHIESFIKTAEILKKLIPDGDITLYVTFIMSKKNKDKTMSYMGFKYEPGKGLQILQSPPPVRVTTIAVKGKFERDYIEVSGLKKLMEYQFAPVSMKLKILKENIEELRKMIESRTYKKVLEMHPEREIIPVLNEIISNAEETSNIAILVAKQRTPSKKIIVPSDTILKLAGLIKTGTDRDFTKERLADVLKYARISVKYEIKKRGYSSKTGVMFSGTPEQILQKALRVIKKMPERLIALTLKMEEVEKEIDSISTISVSTRVGLLDLE